MINDGLYFHLPEEQYHEVNALSATGIKQLLVSQPDYWFRSPMNKNRRDEGSEAKTIGKAFHKRILEGTPRFYQSYAVTFQAPEDCLRTVDDIKQRLFELGVEAKGCKKKDDFLQRLREVDPDAVLYDESYASYLSEHVGKEFLSGDLIGSIEVAAAMIEIHPEISKCFRGGYPEVSVVWTEDGIKFKARFDYLKPSVIVDLKTFGNPLNKPVDAAIYSAMATGKYHIQAAFYLRAVEKAKEFAAGLKVDDNSNAAWLAKLADCKEHGFYFVFQQKGIAPLARCKKFPRDGAYQSGVMAVERAIDIYKACVNTYGEDPWLDEASVEEFSDALFPMYMME